MIKLKGKWAAGGRGLWWSVNEAACWENKAPDTHLDQASHRCRKFYVGFLWWSWISFDFTYKQVRKALKMQLREALSLWLEHNNSLQKWDDVACFVSSHQAYSYFKDLLSVMLRQTITGSWSVWNPINLKYESANVTQIKVTWNTGYLKAIVEITTLFACL